MSRTGETEMQIEILETEGFAKFHFKRMDSFSSTVIDLGIIYLTPR